MAFPEPKPEKPELPKKLVQNLECKQGAVRAVRFNGEYSLCPPQGWWLGRNSKWPGLGGGSAALSGHHLLSFTHLPLPAVDGNYCLTCGSDKSLKLWNPHKGTVLKTYSGHGYEVLDAAG